MTEEYLRGFNRGKEVALYDNKEAIELGNILLSFFDNRYTKHPVDY